MKYIAFGAIAVFVILMIIPIEPEAWPLGAILAKLFAVGVMGAIAMLAVHLATDEKRDSRYISRQQSDTPANVFIVVPPTPPADVRHTHVHSHHHTHELVRADNGRWISADGDDTDYAYLPQRLPLKRLPAPVAIERRPVAYIVPGVDADDDFDEEWR